MTSAVEPTFARPYAAAGVLFTDESQHVLLVVPSYKDYYDIPGGFVEPGETPKAAAQREVHEELGIEPPVGRLLVVDWLIDSNGEAKVLFVFDGGQLSASDRENIHVDGSEIIGFGFHPIDEVQSLTIPRLHRRIHQAVAARLDGTTRYLEAGLSATPPDNTEGHK